MNRISTVGSLGVVLVLAGCAPAGADSGGYGSLIGATYQVCGSQGRSLAEYLNTGSPESMDPQFGDQRQQVLSRSGEKRALLIRRITDAYIQQCDRQQTQAAQQAAQQSSAAAAASASASASTAEQQVITQYLQPTCKRVGGELSTSSGQPSCENVSFYGTDGQQYRDGLATSGASLVPDSSHGDETSATPAQCMTGYYPDGGAGPVHGKPGHYAYGLCLANWK